MRGFASVVEWLERTGTETEASSPGTSCRRRIAISPCCASTFRSVMRRERSCAGRGISTSSTSMRRPAGSRRPTVSPSGSHRCVNSCLVRASWTRDGGGASRRDRGSRSDVSSVGRLRRDATYAATPPSLRRGVCRGRADTGRSDHGAPDPRVRPGRRRTPGLGRSAVPRFAHRGRGALDLPRAPR